MRILLAVDGSASSIQARDLVGAIAWPAATTIRLVAVYDDPARWLGIEAWSTYERFAGEGDTRAELGWMLDEAARPLENRGWLVEREILGGRPATAILEEAGRWMPDLVVVGSRGHGPLASLVLGSVSAEIADRACCPVLVARTDRVERLLIADDASESAERIPDILAAWRIFRDRSTLVLNVLPIDRLSVRQAAPPPDAALDDAPWPSGMLAERQQVTERFALRLRLAGLRARTDVRIGDPAAQIVDAARATRADLIVTGSRGRSGLERAVLGSVARNVLLHAPCSVLVMRARPPARGESRERTAVAALVSSALG